MHGEGSLADRTGQHGNEFRFREIILEYATQLDKKDGEAFHDVLMVGPPGLRLGGGE